MAWTLYKEIKYALDGIPGENLTDFPKRFAIVGDSDIAAELASGGGVKVTSADGTTDLPIELLAAGTSLASGNVEFWTKLTLLTAANVGDVLCRLYYSSDESTTQDSSAVWSNNYALVLHLEQDPSGSAPQMYDSVSETNVGTSAGSMTSGDLVTGQVGKGLDFDGSDDEITFTHDDFGDTFTLEAIVTPSSISGTRNIISSNNSSSGVHMRGNGSSLQIHHAYGVITQQASVFSTGVTRAIAYASNGPSGEHALYADGAILTASGASVTWSNGTSRKIGCRSTSEFYSGVIDEVRISTIGRSAHWLAYSYTDQFDNADTFTLGDEEGATGEVDSPVSGSLALLGVGI